MKVPDRMRPIWAHFLLGWPATSDYLPLFLWFLPRERLPFRQRQNRPMATGNGPRDAGHHSCRAGQAGKMPALHGQHRFAGGRFAHASFAVLCGVIAPRYPVGDLPRAVDRYSRRLPLRILRLPLTHAPHARTPVRAGLLKAEKSR